MNQDTYDVTTVIHAHLILSDSTTTDVAIELGYRASDPFAIHAEFVCGDSTTTWLLARDLFDQGLVSDQDSAAGDGDVHIWRDEDLDYLLLSLTGALGTALLAAPAEPLERFMDETHVRVPVGMESDRFDSALDAFVASILTT
ncbi:SsgA family sporulation/cell division regulator [Pengzhenrongella frigida]|uniref:SsgA family sporulation/cell division regulator n=1 Tax=Pengzhenrongella frigida TaxID=1259133 RepID=A0A4Q5N399_9MICO|nr:SsgA family sporulation/cell division regulator [Cellulomonas sp. HLT2-17]RYV52660.1 SsgA family sporulation/cell division regulator [Cellulomonas sp. HLT2-17]